MRRLTLRGGLRAEDTGTDEARLAAYDVMRQMISWLRAPLAEPPAR